jgi:hypothetical protein
MQMLQTIPTKFQSSDQAETCGSRKGKDNRAGHVFVRGDAYQL